MTDEEFFARLAEPFPASAIKFRPHDGLPYVNARSVMTRLDSVCGPAGWRDEYVQWSDNSVLCKLTIRLPDGRELTKQDLGAYNWGTPVRGGEDPGDREKAGFSDGLKRAAVKFGIAREVVSENYPAPKTIRMESPKPAPEPFGKPASGSDLLRRLQGREGKGGADGLVGHVLGWGMAECFPDDMRKWDLDQADRGYAEAQRFMRRRKART